MRIKSDSHVVLLGYALRFTEACSRVNGDVVVEYHGRWYKGHADSQVYRIANILES
jgi:hypothetical protein